MRNLSAVDMLKQGSHNDLTSQFAAELAFYFAQRT